MISICAKTCYIPGSISYRHTAEHEIRQEQNERRSTWWQDLYFRYSSVATTQYPANGKGVFINYPHKEDYLPKNHSTQMTINLFSFVEKNKCYQLINTS